MTGAGIRLDPFYPIVDHCDWLVRLLPLGVRLVQLRIKDRPAQEVKSQVTGAKMICQQYGCQLIVNDYWRLALDLECDYVHLGQEDLQQADIDALRRAGVRIGISTHSHAELEHALGYQPDYIALGPVYSTLLKKMPWSPQGVERVREWKQIIGDLPLIGIGGLNLERAEAVFKAGADVVSVVTDITLNTDPEAQIRHWLALTEKYRQAETLLPM